MDHLFLTVKYLLKDIETNADNEFIPLTMPPDVSIYDWKSNIRYLGKVIRIKSSGSSDLISLIDKDFERMFNNPQKIKKASAFLNGLCKLAGSSDYDNWEFNEIENGFINLDKLYQKIIFNKGSINLDIARELWRNKNHDASTRETAMRATLRSKNNNDIDFNNARKSIHVLKKRFRKAENEKKYSFPFQISNPSRNRVGLFYK